MADKQKHSASRRGDTRSNSTAHHVARAATVVVNVSLCKYSVVRDCARARGWRLIKEKEDDAPWDLWWQDVSVATDRVTRMAPWQKINHIPGMAVLHTKTGLARTLNRSECD